MDVGAIILSLSAAGLGVFLSIGGATSPSNSYNRFAWKLQLANMVQIIMFGMAGLVIGVAISTLYLAAFLHRKHTEMFVKIMGR